MRRGAPRDENCGHGLKSGLLLKAALRMAAACGVRELNAIDLADVGRSGAALVRGREIAANLASRGGAMLDGGCKVATGCGREDTIRVRK